MSQYGSLGRLVFRFFKMGFVVVSISRVIVRIKWVSSCVSLRIVSGTGKLCVVLGTTKPESNHVSACLCSFPLSPFALLLCLAGSLHNFHWSPCLHFCVRPINSHLGNSQILGLSHSSARSLAWPYPEWKSKSSYLSAQATQWSPMPAATLSMLNNCLLKDWINMNAYEVQEL